MRLLLVQHLKRKNTGNIISYVKDKGIEADILRLWETPDMDMPDATGYDGIIILGGTMNVHDDFPFLIKEVEFIREHLQRVPMLGICLGGQLIAHALGAEVKEDSDRRELGFDVVKLTDAGKEHPLFSCFPERVPVLQWHGQSFELPEGASLLASSATCPYQAFAQGSAYGIQFHLEITPALGREIYEEGKEWALERFHLNEDKFLVDLETYELIIKTQCYQLLDNFLKIET